MVYQLLELLLNDLGRMLIYEPFQKLGHAIHDVLTLKNDIFSLFQLEDLLFVFVEDGLERKGGSFVWPSKAEELSADAVSLVVEDL